MMWASPKAVSLGDYYIAEWAYLSLLNAGSIPYIIGMVLQFTKGFQSVKVSIY